MQYHVASMAVSRVVLIACGSFNPITNMHLRMFELARDHLHGSGRYSVVGGIISPVSDAYTRKALAPGVHRCTMARLALKSCPWIVLDTWECEQNKWLETVSVLRHYRDVLDINANVTASTQSNNPAESSIRRFLRNEQTGIMEPVQLKFLCGADVLESFAIPGLYKDSDIQEIVTQFGMVVISRADRNPTKFIYESDTLSKYKNNIDIVTEWIPNEISSTKVRTALRRNHSVRYLLQDNVIEYIHQNRLYGVTSDSSRSTDSCAISGNDGNTYDDDDKMWRCFTQPVSSPTDVRIISPYNQYDPSHEYHMLTHRPSYETTVDNGFTYKRSKSLEAHRNSNSVNLLSVDRYEGEPSRNGQTRGGGVPMAHPRARSFEGGRGGSNVGRGYPLSQPTGYVLGHVGQTGGYHQGYSIGQTQGHLIEHPGQQYIGQGSGYQMGHCLGHTMEQSTGQPMGHTTGHSDVQIGLSVGQSVGHSTGQSMGHTMGQTGHSSSQSTGHPIGQSMGHPVRQQSMHQSGYRRHGALNYDREQTSREETRHTNPVDVVAQRREIYKRQSFHSTYSTQHQQSYDYKNNPRVTFDKDSRTGASNIKSPTDAACTRDGVHARDGARATSVQQKYEDQKVDRYRQDRSSGQSISQSIAGVSYPARQSDYPTPPPPPVAAHRREASVDSITSSDKRRLDYRRNVSADGVDPQNISRMEDNENSNLIKSNSASERGRSKTKETFTHGSWPQPMEIAGVQVMEDNINRRDTLTDSGNSSFASTTNQRYPPDYIFGAERLAAMTRKVARISPTPETCV